MFRALAHRNFRLFFIGQFLSLTGGWMQNTASAWLVYRLTKDPLIMGLMVFVGQFPVFLFGFYAGALVDRLDHRRLIVAMQLLAMLQAAVLAALTLSGRVELWHLFVLTGLLGVINALDMPVRQVFIGEMVGEADRPNAIALNSTIVNASRIIGPALAGLLIGLYGEGICFAGNALSYVSILGALSLMAGIPPSGGVGAARDRGSLWDDIGKGLSYGVASEPIRLLLLLLTVFSMMGLPIYVLLPVFADEVLHSGPKGLGLLSAASGLGSTFGALFLARRPDSKGLGFWIMSGLVIFAAALAGFAFSTWFWLSGVMIWATGFSAILILTGTNTLLQELCAERYRGRIMSFYSMIFIGLAPLGSFLFGAVASRLGASWTVLLQAALCFSAFLLYRRRIPAALELGPKA